MTHSDIQALNRRAKTDPAGFVEETEAEYHGALAQLARTVHNNPEKRILLLAGPSASGKTTTAALLIKQLETMGCRAVVLSLDNFYRDRSDAPLLENGSPDYETVHALDLRELERCFLRLLQTRECVLPVFDFEAGGRRLQERQLLRLGRGDVIVVEGLHALHPYITAHLPRESLIKIYINVLTRISGAAGDVLLARRDLRFVRRLVRDDKFRASSAENTYMLWQNVRRGEETYLFPFRETADIVLDSTHAYEPCVLRQFALPLLERVAGEYQAQARTLCGCLRRLEEINPALVPVDSLLREFIG